MSKFTVSGQNLYAALSIVSKVVGPSPEMLTIKAFKKKIEIRAYNNMLSMLTVVDAEVENVSEFSLQMDRLKAITNRRGPMEFTVEDQVMKYRALSGAYKGDIVISGTTPIEILYTQGLPEIPVVDVSEFLTFVDLKPVVGKEMLLFFVAKNNFLFLAAGDNYHAALVSIKKEVPDLELMLPMSYQKLFSSVFGAKPYALYKTSSFFFAKNSTLLLQLPVIDAGDISFSDIKNYIDQERKFTSAFGVHSQAVKDAIESIGSIDDNTKSVKITLNNSTITLAMQSNIGSASDQIEVSLLQKTKKQPPISLAYNMLIEILSKAAKTTEFNAFLDGSNSIKLETSHKGAKIIFVLSAVSE